MNDSLFWFRLLDLFFILFHSALILFNLFGWIFQVTRRWNMIALLLTLLSWFGLGIFYGWGYCFCTDWHWQVRRRLGDDDLPGSYIKFLLDGITGLNFPPQLVDNMALGGLIVAVICSLYVNFRHRSLKL